MRLIGNFIVTVILCMLFSGCTAEVDNVSDVNTVYPMILNEDETELVEFLGSANSLHLLTFDVDETINSFKLWVDVYKKGAHIREIGSMRFSVGDADTFNISVKDFGIGEWEFAKRSSGGGASSIIRVPSDLVANDKLLLSKGFLNYSVKMEVDEDQILGFYYFGEKSINGFEASFYEQNELGNISDYEYVYVIRGMISADDL